MGLRDILSVKVLVVGFILAFIYTFLQIYIELKVGFVTVTGMEILGFIMLSLLGRKDKKANVIVIVITTASVLVNIGVLAAFPAIVMFSHIPGIEGTKITPLLIFTMIFLTGFTGLFLLEPTKESFMDEPWPQIAAQVENLETLTKESVSAKKEMLMGLGGAAAYTSAIYAANNATGMNFREIPSGLGYKALPPYIGINNSPMLVGIGFFAGYKRTMLIFAGAVFSMIIWFLFEHDPTIFFGDHATRPEIFYTAIGIIASTIGLDAYKAYKESKTVSLEEEEEEAREVFLASANIKFFLRQWKYSILSLGFFFIVSTLLFSVFDVFPNIHIPVLLIFIGLPLALISAFFVARAASETGLVIGFITDALAVPAVLFFAVNFPSVILFMTSMAAIQSAAVTLLGRYVLGRRLGVDDTTVRYAAILGTLFGTIIGTILIYTFYLMGFGTHEFPAPTAQIMGFTVLGLMELTSLTLPFAEEYGVAYLLFFLILGIVLSILLDKYNLSPINLAVGLLIPPSYAFPLLAGGLLSRHAKKKGEEIEDKYKQVLGGVVAGEGIIVAIQVMYIAVTELLL
ncbi:MAG: OPT/YSL family transporter [Candidatus Odinarchaeota archaeon]|nr:OPT/YSL family transporter [Candidatus Odinarchaeota archaeon]